MPYPSDLIGTWIANNTAYGNLVIASIQVDTNNIGTVTGTWNSVNIPVSTSGTTTVTVNVPIVFGQSFYSNGDSTSGASYLTLVAKGSVKKPDGSGTLNFYLTLSGFMESGNTTKTMTATVVYDGDRAGAAHDSSPKQFAWVRR